MTINSSNIFAQKDILGFQDLIADELNKIPATENPKIVATALKAFLENKPMEESLPSSLKNRLVPIQELLDNPDDYVQEEEKYEAFRQIIKGRIQEEVDYLEKMSPESQTKRVEYQEKKETKKAEETEMFEKLTKQAASRLNERTTETLHEFLRKQVEEGRIGGEWKMEVLVGHEAVIDHYLVFKNYLSRDDFLKLTVSEFLELGDPTNEAEYAVQFKESNRPLSLTDIQLAAKRKLLQKIRNMHPSEITHLISSSLIFQRDREIMLEAIKNNTEVLQYASPELKNDRDFILEAIKQKAGSLQYASDALKADRDIVLEAIKKDAYLFEYASDALKADKEFFLAAIKQNKSVLHLVPSKLENDREIVLETIKHISLSLKDLSDVLKTDKEVVLEFVKKDGMDLKYASDALKADRDVVLEAVKDDGMALQYAPDTLKTDRDVVLEAVKKDGRALQYASDTLKADREIVLEAVKKNGRALRLASDALKEDREIKEIVLSSSQNH